MTEQIFAPSMLALVKQYAQTQPNKLCVADPLEQMSYGTFFERIESKTGQLAEMGVQAGDRIMAEAAQRGDFLALLFAVHRLQAVFVPLERNLPQERIAAIRAKTGATLMLQHSELRGKSTAPAGAYPAAEQAATILFTTGTTGTSKGILLSHGAEVAVAENVFTGTEMEEDTVELIPMPVSHSYGLRHCFGLLFGGRSIVLCDGVALAGAFFAMMERHGVNALSLTPAAVHILWQLTGDRLGAYADRIRYVQLGTAGVDASMKARMRSLLPHSRLYQYYSSTEAGCACLFDFQNDFSLRRVGKPACNATFAIMNEQGNEIASDEQHWGYIACKGPMNMTAYYGEAELTAQTMINGYVRSQDIGYIDAEGYICFVSRAGDVINTGGFKVAPEEVESVAIQFGGIRECAVSGVSDALLGQVPKLYIVPERPEEAFDEAGLIAYLSGRLEHYKVPRQIERLSALPRNKLGKLLRNQCENCVARQGEISDD